jgi:hypothetical protein
VFVHTLLLIKFYHIILMHCIVKILKNHVLSYQMRIKSNSHILALWGSLVILELSCLEILDWPIQCRLCCVEFLFWCHKWSIMSMSFLRKVKRLLPLFLYTHLLMSFGRNQWIALINMQISNIFLTFIGPLTHLLSLSLSLPINISVKWLVMQWYNWQKWCQNNLEIWKL